MWQKLFYALNYRFTSSHILFFFLLGMAYNAGKKFENSQKMKFVFIKWIPCGYESSLKYYRRLSNVVRALVIVCCSLCVTFFGLTTFWCYLQSYHWTNAWQHVHESSLLNRWLSVNLDFYQSEEDTPEIYLCSWTIWYCISVRNCHTCY